LSISTEPKISNFYSVKHLLKRYLDFCTTKIILYAILKFSGLFEKWTISEKAKDTAGLSNKKSTTILTAILGNIYHKDTCGARLPNNNNPFSG
jgi:hypothetical protein